MILLKPNKHALQSKACPKCGGSVRRAKRSTKHKIFNFLTLGILRIRRYRCKKCGWKGVITRFDH